MRPSPRGAARGHDDDPVGVGRGRLGALRADRCAPADVRREHCRCRELRAAQRRGQRHGWPGTGALAGPVAARPGRPTSTGRRWFAGTSRSCRSAAVSFSKNGKNGNVLSCRASVARRSSSAVATRHACGRPSWSGRWRTWRWRSSWLPQICPRAAEGSPHPDADAHPDAHSDTDAHPDAHADTGTDARADAEPTLEPTPEPTPEPPTPEPPTADRGRAAGPGRWPGSGAGPDRVGHAQPHGLAGQWPYC